MSKITPPATPALFDKTVLDFNQKLKAAHAWITETYGICQHLTVESNNAHRMVASASRGRTVRFPGVYTGTGKDYLPLFPDESLGNFAYWDFDPYEIKQLDNQIEIIRANFGVIFWMNVAKVLDPGERRNLESIKEELLATFRRTRIPQTRVRIYQITPRHEDIYRGFNLNEIDQQHLMHPYAGLRFNGQIELERTCP